MNSQHLTSAPKKEPLLIVGASKHAEEMNEFVERMNKKYPFAALLTGPTGSGKDYLAEVIQSRRGIGSFVSVNCASIPDGLLESELFGYVKGAFTSATVPKKGLLETAENGTIFFDEIGNMPLAMQAKILHLIEEKAVYRKVGATSDTPIKTRFIFATNVDLEEAVSRGAFREDLYYRINSIQFRVPSLVERREDIAPLAHYFLGQEAKKFGSQEVPGSFSGAALEIMLSHSWPGNVRELRNLARYATFYFDGNWEVKAELVATYLRHSPQRVTKTNVEPV